MSMPENIQQIVESSFQQSLSLNASLLGVQCYSDLLALFQTERLQLKSMPTDFVYSNNLLTFSGEVQSVADSTTSSPVLAQPSFKVNFCVFDVNGNRQAVLLLSLSATNYLQNSQAPVGQTQGPESLFDLYVTLSTTNDVVAQMVYSSLSTIELTGTAYNNRFQSVVAQANLKVGLNFPLSFTLNTDFDQYINTLFGGTGGEINGYAEVSVRENALQALSKESALTIPSATSATPPTQEPYLLVYQALNNASLSFPPYSSTSPKLSVTLNNIGLGFPLANNDSVWPEVFLDGSVIIGTTSLDIQAAYFLYHGVLSLEFSKFPKLKDLLSSFCTPSDYFPAPFDVLLDIELSDLEILIDIHNKTVLEINLTVTTDQSIDVIDGIISVKPTLTLQIQQPFDSTNRKLEGMFSADWILGSTKFDTFLTYPNYDFNAQLAAGETLDVSALENEVLAGVTLPNLDISALEVHGNLTQKSFAFSLTVDSDLTLPLLGGNVLKVEQVQLGMGYNSGQRSYELIGTFDVAGAQVYVSADYDGDNWQFQGSSYPTATILFSDLFKALPGNDSNSDAVTKITDQFPSLEIDAINFSYNTGDKSFQIGAMLAVELISTSYPFTFSVARQENGDSFSWKVAGKSDFQTPVKLSDIFNDFIKHFTFASDLTLPASISNDLNIQSLSFNYNTSTDEFDCGFSLTDPPSISTVIGGDISSAHIKKSEGVTSVSGKKGDSDSPYTFSTFTLKRVKENKQFITKLNIKIDKGILLFDLVDLKGDLPTTLNHHLKEIDFTITLQSSDVESNNTSTTKYEFSTTFEDDGHSFNFIGAYEGIKSTDISGSPETKSFGGTIYSSNGNALTLGDGFPIQGGIKDLFIAKISLPKAKKSASSTIDTTTYTIFGSDLSAHADIDLGTLPVVGEFLTEAKFNFKSLRFVYAKGSLIKAGSKIATPVTTPISNDNLQTINSFLAKINVASLSTSRSTTSPSASSQQTFDTGFTLQGSLVLGNNADTIPLHTNFSSKPTKTPLQPKGKTPISSVQVSPSASTSPKAPTPVGKKFGPVTIKKVGLGLSGGKVEITFTGGITMGPLTLDFIDLEVKSPVDKFDPSISLQGLGVGIKKPPLTLEGLFMESMIDVPVASYEISTISPGQLKVTDGSTTIANQSYIKFTVDIPTSGTPTPDTVVLTLSNTVSTEALNIRSIKCSGKDFAMSSVSCPITLNESSTTETMHVIFTPQSSGLKEGSLIIESDDATVPKFKISLRGNQTSTKSSLVKTIPVTAYNGSLSIGYKDYSLTAIGSYAKLPDDTISAFLYGFLGAPLGGPPFFLVTGVAAGFGYNRAFTLPTAETVNTYPLIQPVMPNAGSSMNFASMNLLFMPEKGDFWGAVGVRGETFKMIESFVLLDVQFKEDIEIDIIGLSHMQFPKPPDNNKQAPALAKLNVGLVARIIPEMGIVSVNGAFLAGSYILNPLAHISGGFALLGVFKDQESGQWKGGEAGDFVITIGGYASSYKPKSYYPQVPRLELNWQVSSCLSLKASAYFAITPQAMMAGGNLVASLQVGGEFSIHANFTISADFIIWWKPYHYSADVYIDLDVSVSIHLLFIHASLNLDLGADLSVYGPSFSGNGFVHVHVLVSFSVHVSFGDGTNEPAAISWNEFKSSLLPEADKIITGNISNGLVASQSSPVYNVVNPKELQITCGSAIPLREINVSGKQLTNPKKHVCETFGIKPMALTATDITISELKITAKLNGVSVSIFDSFIFEEEFKNMPAAIWKPAETTTIIPDQSGSHLLKNLCTGIKISAKPPTTSGDGFVFDLADANATLTMPAATATMPFTYL